MSVASILAQMAENAGRAQRERGALIGGTISDAAQVPAQIMADRQKAALLARQQAAQDAQLRFAGNADARAGSDQRMQEEALQREQEKQNVLKAGIAAGFGQSTDPKDFNLQAAAKAVTDAGHPELVTTIADVHNKFQKPAAMPVFGKPGEVGFDPITRERIPGMEVPPNPPAPRPLTFGQPTDVVIGGKHVLIRAGSDGASYGMDGQKVPTNDIRPYEAPKGENEPLVAIMGPDGNPVLVPRSKAVGQRPASNREQGRAVTSGDAGRIAEIDNSLDDIKRLGAAIASAGNTGTIAAVGASMPNWVTNMTGWGTDAKKKQALIDRVKQVIGKALEGGVLRKEDELKYEKILPTIGDPNDVVTSKLSGLDTAIRGKRERAIESLTDAGYDASRFARTEKDAPNAGPAVGDRRMINGQLGEWDGKGWKAVVPR